MWRTGGTYLAFSLRERNPVALFYEPLHEDFSKFTREEWDRFSEPAVAAARRHPVKSFHYLSDYPFLSGAGVAGHREEFAFRRFVLVADADAPDLADYLAGLMRHASTTGRRSLFKFCRGFLRQSWLKARLDPITVYLARKPEGMRASYARIGAGAYFYSGYLRILALNRNEPILAPVHEFVAASHRDYADADEARIDSVALAGTVSPETIGDVFLFFWALALAAHADPEVLTLDAAALGADARSRAEGAKALARHAGLDVDLSDALALDAGNTEISRFRQPEFGRFLRRALEGARLDTRGFSAAIARQFEALLCE